MPRFQNLLYRDPSELSRQIVFPMTCQGQNSWSRISNLRYLNTVTETTLTLSEFVQYWLLSQGSKPNHNFVRLQ